MKRWFTLFAVMMVALGSIALAGCTPKEEGATDEGGDAAGDAAASLSIDSGAAASDAAAATEGS